MKKFNFGDLLYAIAMGVMGILLAFFISLLLFIEYALLGTFAVLGIIVFGLVCGIYTYKKG